ncbi:glucose-6-phosphate dehydrogenase [Microbacterium sp. CFBP9034]|uniref:glucose-6-phosphate dehydrogenase n=1 Tax=Microbacterium sp. CFBP9034 TaxID=3096540 RepID=UPI002A6AB472|nr:glucose-6-phosphate dehydrogenase [Microbacterium sp. CFBP9034]MDY0910873.1 glucose-6-phosphate dehydrogenase [Microbacterium sp. CFBP9034]
MKVVSSSDWRDGLAFESPALVADISPGEDARCVACGAESELLPRTELWAVKHRHPKNHDGFVRFYCRAHVPAIKRVEAPTTRPARTAAPRAERQVAPRRSAAAVERPRDLCPDCFVEIPPTNVCGMCGRTFA